MKGTSKVIMGATLVMVVSLAIVLGLVLVLLAELYCSLLLRRRQFRITTTSSSTSTATATAADATANTTTTSNSQPPQSQPQHQPSNPPPLTTFYAHGVLNAPRNFLFPSLDATQKDKVDDIIEKPNSQLRQFLESQTQKSTTSPHRNIGLISSSPSSPPPPSPSFLLPLTSSPQIQQAQVQVQTATTSSKAIDKDHFVYISNPIFDNNDHARPISRVETPFQTPDTSPSRLTGGDSFSSGDDEEIADQPSSSSRLSSSLPITPPLTPMKKLPAQACSVSLRDARSLGTSGSDDSNYSNENGLSSSSSGSPCTSPSW